VCTRVLHTCDEHVQLSGHTCPEGMRRAGHRWGADELQASFRPVAGQNSEPSFVISCQLRG
jgi:hypothetical protein